jgi:hypothetical protein
MIYFGKIKTLAAHTAFAPLFKEIEHDVLINTKIED